MHRWWAAAFRRSDAGQGGSQGGGTPPAGDSGNNGGGARYTSTDIKSMAAAVAAEPDLARAVAAAIERAGGNKDKGVEYALRQGFKARKQRDEALAENARVAGILPAQGDVVLKGDDAKHVSAIIANAKKAGLSLADLAPKIESLPQTESDLKALKDEKTAARAAGEKFNRTALAKAVTQDGLVFAEVDVKSTTKDGEGKTVTKTEKVWAVKKPDAKDADAVVLDKYVDEHEFKASLLSKNSSAQSDASSSVEWPRQSSNANAASGGGDLVSKHIEEQNKRSSAPSAMDFAFGSAPTPPHSGAGGQQDAARRP